MTTTGNVSFFEQKMLFHICHHYRIQTLHRIFLGFQLAFPLKNLPAKWCESLVGKPKSIKYQKKSFRILQSYGTVVWLSHSRFRSICLSAGSIEVLNLSLQTSLRYNLVQSMLISLPSVHTYPLYIKYTKGRKGLLLLQWCSYNA